MCKGVGLSHSGRRSGDPEICKGLGHLLAPVGDTVVNKSPDLRISGRCGRDQDPCRSPDLRISGRCGRDQDPCRSPDLRISGHGGRQRHLHISGSPDLRPTLMTDALANLRKFTCLVNIEDKNLCNSSDLLVSHHHR